jgi:hypothetical protein
MVGGHGAALDGNGRAEAAADPASRAHDRAGTPATLPLIVLLVMVGTCPALTPPPIEAWLPETVDW